ncbi:MAG: hypothetical protein HY903_04580 [Deltaproteobacteria bacterium]|nr:hypothetical protein [Deltaproteobacteria bacterium]
MGRLLAVDLGLKAGLAVYADNGRLQSYASRNFGTRTRLKTAIAHVLAEVPDLRFIVVEGDRTMGAWWGRAALRVGAQTLHVSAEVWRPVLLLPREQHSGVEAKRHALRLSRQVISWSNAPEPTSLRDDAAEAILIGLWGVLAVGWLQKLPRELGRR